MSIRRLPRELGIIIVCNHGDLDGREDCHATVTTANVTAGANRSYAKLHHGWGRGLIAGRKRWDLCPVHLEVEQQEVAARKAKREERRRAQILGQRKAG